MKYSKVILTFSKKIRLVFMFVYMSCPQITLGLVHNSHSNLQYLTYLIPASFVKVDGSVKETDYSPLTEESG